MNKELIKLCKKHNVIGLPSGITESQAISFLKKYGELIDNSVLPEKYHFKLLKGEQ